jgi:alkylhydroperoxidase family enzyme
MDEFLRFAGVLEPELKEEARRALAQHAACRFCASLGEPSASYPDERTQVAVSVAHAVGRNPRELSDEAFERMHAVFSAEEIVELMAWLAFMYASELLGAVFELDPASERELETYERWLSAGFRRYTEASA